MDPREIALVYPSLVKPLPAPGDWADVRVVAGDGLSLAVPAVATMVPTTGIAENTSGPAPLATLRIGPLPGCLYECSVELTVRRDSAGLGLKRWVAGVVARHNDGGDADWHMAAPEEVTISGQRALLLNVPCGDCTKYSLFLEGPGRIAQFDYSFDDREPEWRALGGRVVAMAASLRWSVAQQ